MWFLVNLVKAKVGRCWWCRCCSNLTVAGNQLTGAVPDSISVLTQLTWVATSSCTSVVLAARSAELTVSFDVDGARTMNLGRNQLTGTLPTTIGNLSALVYVRVVVK